MEEILDFSLLNEREKYWIKYYNSNKNGYNIAEGGNTPPILNGELNPNSKLTEKDIINIRCAYKNKERKMDVYLLYKDIISENTFQDVWIGKTWNNIMFEVYTKENKEFHKNNNEKYDITINSNLILEDIENIRELYEQKIKTVSEVYDLYKNKISYDGFKSIWYGYSFPEIKKEIKKEIYNEKRNKITKQFGENNNAAKLTNEDVINIRKSKLNNKNKKDIYNQYKNIISKTTFNNIWNNKSWKNIII